MSGDIWNIMGDESSHEHSYDHNSPQREKRRMQNRLNQRRHRKKAQLAAARSLVEESTSSSHQQYTTAKVLEPTNTYQLRGRNVLQECSQPPLSQKTERQFTPDACESSLDKSRIEPTSEDGIIITNPSVTDGESTRPDHSSQEQTEGQRDYLAQSLHMTNDDAQQPEINLVRPNLEVPQQFRTLRHEQESGQSMSTTTASDGTIGVARGALAHLLSSSPEIQNKGDSPTVCGIPAGPQLHTHIRDSTQDLDATLAQFRTHFQKAFEFVQAPLNELQNHATGLEQELYQRRSGIMRLGNYAASMMIDVENTLEAIEGIEVDTLAIETLLVEISKVAQKRAEEKVQLHTRVKGLEKNLKALQNIVFNIASPCNH